MIASVPYSRSYDSMRTRWAAILTDPQFWTPLVVLVGGLLILRWLQ